MFTYGLSLINNSMYYTYLNDLPAISAELIEEAIQARYLGASTFVDPKHATYQYYSLGGRIAEFTKSIFDFDHVVGLHVIKQGVPVHVDIGRKVAYNFIIEPGGQNVLTAYFNIDDFHQVKMRNLKLLPKTDCPPAIPHYSICLEKCRWHSLDVSIPHSILNIETERVAITVSPKNL